MDPALAALLPGAVEGWKIAAEDQAYNRETLYEYIDGGAELYLSYGFKKSISRTYARPGQPDIVADLFDMGVSRNAFGVFSHTRETVDEGFGQGSQYTSGLLLFWKDRYFVSLLASPETEESKRAAFDLAAKIDAAIAEKGPLPEILSLLPQQALVRESIRYFYHPAWLNAHYFVADQNILHIDENTDALLAKYGDRETQPLLLLVIYPKAKDAELARDDFEKHYLPELSQKRAAQIEDGTWTACELAGDLLTVVFNAPTEGRALQLIEAVREIHSGKAGPAEEKPERKDGER